MKRRICLMLTAFMLAGILTACNTVQKYQVQFFDVFDTFSQITVYTSDRQKAEQITSTAYDVLLECHRLFDIYNDYEGINNLKTVNYNAGIAPVKVDEKLFAMVKYGKEMYYLTGGRMNIVMGSVLRIWHRCRTEGLAHPERAALPSMEELRAAQPSTNIENLILDEENHTIYLADPNMSLDVGALGKGFAVELAADAVEDMGAEGVLLNIGGNVRAIGHRGDGTPWRVGVQNPLEPSGQPNLTVAKLSGLSLVTSGDYQRSYIVDGKAYHHIIDPVTLMPAAYFRQVTVITEDSGLADALSTALFVMPVEEGIHLLESFPGTEALWVCTDGTVIQSGGLRKWQENEKGVGTVNIKKELERLMGENPSVRLNDIDIDPENIRAIMINEIVPQDAAQDFYGADGQLYLSTTLPLFQKAGFPVETIEDILNMGIYITNAVKTPKDSTLVEKSSMEESLPWLEKELELFPGVKVVMLMGDVAKKMYNQITRKTTKRNVIPSGATYKLRSTPFYFGDIRVMPSYIMTGGNILIEKSKVSMVAEDIAKMVEIIGK